MEYPFKEEDSRGISLNRLDSLLNAFTGRRVLVVGDLMIDEYLWGQACRVSPEAPVLVLDVQRTTHTLGGAANVARNIQGMGANVAIAGVVGSDPNADRLLETLQAHDCDVEGVVAVEERCTTLKSRVVAQDQQIVRVDHETREPIDNATSEKLLTFIEQTMPTVDAVILSDYAKGVLTDQLVEAVVNKARQHDVPVTANLKPPRVAPYCGATLLTLNLVEAERAWGQQINSEADLYRCGQVLRKRLDCDGLLVTRGGDGVVLFTSTGAPLTISAQRVQVFDVTGAGDTVISAASMALSAGATLAEAVAIGNLAGNVKVTKLGTAAVDREEIRRFAKEKYSENPSDETQTNISTRWRAAA